MMAEYWETLKIQRWKEREKDFLRAGGYNSENANETVREAIEIIEELLGVIKNFNDMLEDDGK
jgi:hypothetical protein